MKKYILVDFPDGFDPPDTFDGVGLWSDRRMREMSIYDQ